MTTKYPNDPERLTLAKKIMRHKARDNPRTPIQWGFSLNAGFCPADVKPWMRVNDDYRTINAAEQLARPSSVLSYGRITKSRKRHKNVFVFRDFELLDPDHSQVYAYRRFSNNEAWVLVLNFSGQSVDWDIPSKAKLKDWAVGNYKVANRSMTQAIKLG